MIEAFEPSNPTSASNRSQHTIIQMTTPHSQQSISPIPTSSNRTPSPSNESSNMTSSSLSLVRLGFLGGGAMASALAGGIVKSGILKPSSIIVSDISEKQLQSIKQSFQIPITADNNDVIKQSNVIMLSVKPNYIAPVLIAGRAQFNQIPNDKLPLIISIAAGISLQNLSSMLPRGTPIVRVVPNTPALVNKGVSVISGNDSCSADHIAICKALLSSVGTVMSLPESLLDAATGLSGSGPAFVFTMMEAMSDGGVRAGLPRDAATELAARTILGAAELALQTGKHTGQLKDMVTSPNGTTIRGVHEIEKGGVRASFIAAVLAASERSKEMGKELERASKL